MKKFILLLCAMCIAGMASAQLAPINPKYASKFEKSFNTEAKMVMKTAKYDTNDWRYKESIPMWTEPYYTWDKKFGINWIGNIPEDYDYETLGFCQAEEFDWVYGTGGFATYFGSGEIGYRFHGGEGSYYHLQSLYPEYGYPYAAGFYILRAASTATCMKEYDDDGNFSYKKMPIYYKLYNSTKMAPQSVPGNVSGYSHPEIENVDAVYPTDPENYTAKSEMGYAPVWEDEDHGCDGYYPGQDFILLEFLDGATEPLGEDFGVSIVLPVEFMGDGANPEENDYTAETWRWNAFIMCYSQGLSTEPHSVFTVVDWNQQCMFGSESVTREKPETFQVEQQTNDRYSVIPFDSWYWSNGGNTNAEPVMVLLYTERAALESANHADRYVQVKPNPAVDYANFKSFGKMQKIEIFSMNGKLMKSVNGINADEYNLNVSGLKSGMYVARITGEKGVSTKKLVVR